MENELNEEEANIFEQPEEGANGFEQPELGMEFGTNKYRRIFAGTSLNILGIATEIIAEHRAYF